MLLVLSPLHSLKHETLSTKMSLAPAVALKMSLGTTEWPCCRSLRFPVSIDVSVRNLCMIIA